MSDVGFLRDASWYEKPNRSTPKRIHRESFEYPGTPACRPNRVLLAMEAPMILANFSDDLRCRRCYPKRRA